MHSNWPTTIKEFKVKTTRFGFAFKYVYIEQRSSPPLSLRMVQLYRLICKSLGPSPPTLFVMNRGKGRSAIDGLPSTLANNRCGVACFKGHGARCSG